jgi:hypothetical protein
MALRRAKSPKPRMIEVEGIFGTFKVPNANVSVEYVLTYATLDSTGTSHSLLLDLLLPVREALTLEELDFDHLLQRDLDDYRVSTEMVPYLLGQKSLNPLARNPTGPRFFPPIVAVIVPVDASLKVAGRYPKSETTDEPEGDITYRHVKYGSVFSIRREVMEDGALAQSPVELHIHQTKAKLIIVDGQHRAMAMLAAYRNAMNRWNATNASGDFRYFYDQDSDFNPTALVDIQLPVCVTYFPDLSENGYSQSGKETITTACRKIFLDVNKEARPPSKSRTTLLDDTDIAALLTRHVFNMIQATSETSTFKLRHTEYDNPHPKAGPIVRHFALTDVDNVFNIVTHVCMSTDPLIREPAKNTALNIEALKDKERLQRELKLEEFEEELSQLGLKVTDIQRYDFPKQAEHLLRSGFEDAWGRIIQRTFTKFYPFAKHAEAVEISLEENAPYTGENKIAHTALIEGQGLRHALKRLSDRDKEIRGKKGVTQLTKIEKAWKALESIEGTFHQTRTKLYLKSKSKKKPTQEEVATVDRMYACFNSSAFQNGLFMAFACLKDRMNLTNPQFVSQVDIWLDRLNSKFEKSQKVRTVLFDSKNPQSVRQVVNPRGGTYINPKDWPFFRYLIFELLSK